MNAERLLDLYDRVADAPDALGRLRRFVLDLAVRGRLVEQNPADESASELLKRIAVEKARMVRAGEIRAKKPPPNGTRDEVAMSLPGGWSLVHLDQITACLDYLRKPINATERAKRIEGKSDDELFPYYGATQQQGWIDDYLFDEELVLLGEDGAPFLDPFRPKAYLIRGKAWVNNHAHVFRGILVSHPYLVHVLNVFDYSGHVVGATRAKLNQKRALGIPIPLPPLAEQRRIVAKVDELMVLCDRLEETRAEREETRDRLTEASLARLSVPDTDAAAFRGHARFAIHALPALTARNDQVKHLRQTILSLAVRGKLVEQDPADEPASALLELVRSQRPQASRGKRRLVHALNTGAVDEELFALPDGWEWTPLAGVSGVTMGQSPPGETYNRSGDGVPLINGPVEFTTGPFGRTIITQFTTSPKKFCEEGDLLLCVRGSTTGRTNVAGFRACIGRGVAAISSSFDDEFIRIFLWKAREDILAMGRGMAFPSVSKKQLESLPVPLPPLAEQHRIVAKVGELMVLCDRLEDGLGSVAGTRSHLLESLLQGTLTRSAYEAATAGAAWA